MAPGLRDPDGIRMINGSAEPWGVLSGKPAAVSQAATPPPPDARRATWEPQN